MAGKPSPKGARRSTLSGSGWGLVPTIDGRFWHPGRLIAEEEIG